MLIFFSSLPSALFQGPPCVKGVANILSCTRTPCLCVCVYLPRYSSFRVCVCVCRNRVERYFSFFPVAVIFPFCKGGRVRLRTPPPSRTRERSHFVYWWVSENLYLRGRRLRPLGTSAGHYLRTIDRARAHGIWKNARSRVLPSVEPLGGTENGNSFTSAGFIFFFSFSLLRVEHATRILITIIIIIIIATAIHAVAQSSSSPSYYARVNGIQFPSL